MQFPIYRKYSNGKTFFKIHSREEFDELKIIGKKFSLMTFKAKIFTDRLFIQDMIELTNRHWELSDEEEFQEQLRHCRSHLEEL